MSALWGRSPRSAPLPALDRQPTGAPARRSESAAGLGHHRAGSLMNRERPRTWGPLPSRPFLSSCPPSSSSSVRCRGGSRVAVLAAVETGSVERDREHADAQVLSGERREHVVERASFRQREDHAHFLAGVHAVAAENVVGRGAEVREEVLVLAAGEVAWESRPPRSPRRCRRSRSPGSRARPVVILVVEVQRDRRDVLLALVSEGEGDLVPRPRTPRPPTTDPRRSGRSWIPRSA